MSAAILEIDAVSAGYGDEPIVEAVTLAIAPGSITTLVGANGAGKSTLLKALYGLVRCFDGSIRLEGVAIERLDPVERLRRGLAFVPQGRCNFPMMSVTENLALGTYTLSRAAAVAARERITALFPILRDKAAVAAGNLSGGEQQILEMAMVLVTAPKVLLLDEPSIGLSPKNLAIVLRTIRDIRDAGATIVMVEQNVKGALAISDTAVVMELGRITAQGPAAAIATDPVIARAYLGVRPPQDAAQAATDRRHE
jgi:branched-chain amino acid transport system ATP-binding protein